MDEHTRRVAEVWLARQARAIPVDSGYVRGLAEKVAKKLEKRADKGSGEDLMSTRFRKQEEPIGVAAFFTVVGREDEEHRVSIYISVGKKWRWGLKQQFVSSGKVVSDVDHYKPDRTDTYKYQLGITLYEREVDAYRDSKAGAVLRKELYSILLHEYTHLRDRLYDRGLGDPYKLERSVYYNLPEEVRAFMAQVVDETMVYAWDYLKSMDGWASVQSLVEYVLGHRGGAWNQIEKHLNTKNRKIVLKSVYQALAKGYDPMMLKYERMAKRLKRDFDPPYAWLKKHKRASSWRTSQLDLSDVWVTSELENVEDAWKGGIADLGDSRAARAIQRVPGYDQYEESLQGVVKRQVGSRFWAYRAMSSAEVDYWEEGSSYGFFAFTLEPRVAHSWATLAVSGERTVYKVPIEYDSVVMRGKAEEAELVIRGSDLDWSRFQKVGR